MLKVLVPLNLLSVYVYIFCEVGITIIFCDLSIGFSILKTITSSISMDDHLDRLVSLSQHNTDFSVSGVAILGSKSIIRIARVSLFAMLW
jgi:hypothetical protein